jgi:hypothetical protein
MIRLCVWAVDITFTLLVFGTIVNDHLSAHFRVYVLDMDVVGSRVILVSHPEQPLLIISLSAMILLVPMGAIWGPFRR